MIVESNIKDSYRTYRDFCNIVTVYRPGIDIATIKVIKTSKGNWKVLDKDGNKICLVSKNILNDALVKDNKLCPDCVTA